jgi:hypothetical protein
MPQKKQSAKNRNTLRSTDTDASGIRRTNVGDGQHIGYKEREVDLSHLSPRARRMMGIKD